MKYLTPFRIATYLLMLFFVGHTGGGMLSSFSAGPAADAVFASMKSVHFDFNGSIGSWYGMWFGFGLMVSVFLLFSAVVAWQLDKVGPESWPAVSIIAWALVATQVLNIFVSWAYFFAGPVVFGILISILLSVGAWRKGRAAGAQARAP